MGVQADYDKDDGRTEIQILYSDESQLDRPDDSIQILLAGVSLLIRSVDGYDSGLKSHELLEMSIETLKEHYIDPDSFVEVENNFFKKDED